MAFDPDAYLAGDKVPAKAATKGFDPDAYLAGTSSPSEPAAKEGIQTTALGTLARSGAESAVQVPGIMYGAGMGAELGTMAAGPVGGVVGGIVGGIGMGILQSMGINSLEQFADSVFGTNLVATKRAQAEQHPIAEITGGVAGFVGGPGSKMASIPQMFTKEGAKKAAVGAGAMTGIGGTMRAVEGQDVLDPKAIAADIAGGALGRPSKLGTRLEAAGARAVGGKPAAVVPPKVSEKPPADAPPEVRAAYVEELKRRSKERDAKAPLEQTAFRDKDGNIIKSGPKHSEEMKLDPTLEQGFVTERDQFLTREEAIDQAKRAGQIPEDHVLENPPGEQPGLHSGDMRKVGDERFKVTEEQPQGVPTEPKAPDEAPKSREDFKKAVDDSEWKIYTLEEEANNAANSGDTARQQEINLEMKALQDKADQLRKDIPAVQFENPSKPSWEELQDHLWGATNLGQAFDRVLSNKDIGGKGQRLLLQALSKSNFIRGTSLHFTTEHIKFIDPKDGVEKTAAGQYTGGKEHMVEMGKEGNLQVLAHEAIHAGTHRLLEEGNSTAAAKLHDLFAKYNAKQGKEINPKTGEPYYGFANVHEFVSEAFTSNAFQKILSKIDAGVQPKGGTGSLWSKFKEAIREGLNLPEGSKTALDEVLDAGTTLLIKSKDYHPYDGAPSGSIPTPSVEWNKPRSVPSKTEEHLTEEAPKVVKEIDKIDPRSMPNKEAMLEHATDLYEKYGEEQALKFIEDFNKDQSQRSIPVRGKLEDVLHKIKTFMTADSSEFNTWYREAKKQGVSKEQTREWFDMRERGEELPPEGKAVHEAYDKEQKALYDKAVAMGLPVGAEYKSGQSRVRLYDTRDVTKNFKDMVKEFFSDKSPMTEKMAEQADSAIERKVYQLDDGRVIEIHRIQEDAKVPMKDKDGKTTFRNVRKGTEVWEWNNGKKKMIGHTEDLNFKMGDKIKVIGKDGKGLGEQTMVDGKVGDIETHSPYRYLHDSMASQALAIMGLRKMVREAELLTNLKNNADFKKVAHSPDQPIETIPKGWKTPESIEKIPQLRGYHFDPKTAAIIEDFARVYDPTILSKMTAALVKNMMLNPLPHMFNEAMHLFNARGFTGWVNPVRGLEFVRTARKAWNDVGNQTQVYRDAMKAGGSMLGADPRNKMFDAIIKENSKEMFKQPEMQRSMGQLAKKLGTTVGDLYNGISNKSQEAMWFTRDVMYMQLLHETMARSDKSTGGKMSVEEGVAKVERHLPNYRMPEKVLGSRGLSKALQNPNIAVFSRYHYGMLKSIANTLKDINPKNLKTLEGRKDFRESVDSILAISVAMAVLYPLMDKLAQAITGDDEAEMRRAGPYHLYHAGEQVVKGEKDLSALVYPIFTFNPMLLTLGQALYNKNLFSGKEIYHPQDPVGDQLTDAAKYFVKQVPQAPGLMGVGGGDSQATTGYIAKQLDVKSMTDKQREAERTARKRAAAQAKGRATRREKGTL